MFEHSVKVPRHYKIVANIVKKVSTEGGSVKTLLYDDKLRHFKTNVLYALITETIKHAAEIDKIFESCQILENEPRLDTWLAKVLTTELLFGKKTLPGKSRPEQTILSYKEKFETYTSEHQDDFKTEAIRRPRYVRINTNLLTTSDAIRAFQDEGYRFIRCTSGSYDDYLEQIQGLTEYDFTQDYHVKTIFVFAAGTKFHEHELYLENQIILQDKATAMAVHLLAPPAGSVCLDMCAAPGMKTTQLAAYIRNRGRIYAVERNEKRYETLCDFVKRTGSKCVKTIHKDALEIKRGDYDDVEYIILDPSCSGSGMDLCVHNYIEETRLAKLTSLQEKFLKHAMNAFPKVKRIVYSTCSLFPEENERVITNVVKTSRTKWRVQDINELLKGQWTNFGSGMYGSMGARCMYARPDKDFTTGFFLAVLDRDQKDFEKCQNREHNIDMKDVVNENVAGEKASKKKKAKDDGDSQEDLQFGIQNLLLNEADDRTSKKKKKRKNKAEVNETDGGDGTNNQDSNIENAEGNEVPKKKKKKEKHQVLENTGSALNDSSNIETIEEDDAERKKKKKKRKHASESEPMIINEPENTQVEEIPKKKKKKNKHCENVETEEWNESESVETTLIEPIKKKKKRDSNLLTENEN